MNDSLKILDNKKKEGKQTKKRKKKRPAARIEPRIV